jgi:integrase
LLWDLKKNNYADSTIKSVRKSLEKLARYCNLNKPDEVKTFLATFDRSNDYKRILANSYDLYVKYNDLKWEKPKYKQTSRIPKIPTETKINSLIAFTSSKLATAISISKDTGIRPTEAMNLRLKDIDLEHKTVHPKTAKNGPTQEY